jgi:hypothetical protein
MPKNALSNQSYRLEVPHQEQDPKAQLSLRTSMFKNRLKDSTRAEKRRKESECTPKEDLYHQRKALPTSM